MMLQLTVIIMLYDDEAKLLRSLQKFYSLPISGPFEFEVSLSFVQCQNNLTTHYLSCDKSPWVDSTKGFLQQVAYNRYLLSMSKNFHLFLWK